MEADRIIKRSSAPSSSSEGSRPQKRRKDWLKEDTTVRSVASVIEASTATEIKDKTWESMFGWCKYLEQVFHPQHRSVDDTDAADFSQRLERHLAQKRGFGLRCQTASKRGNSVMTTDSPQQFFSEISSVVFANMFLSPSIHVNFGMEAWLKRLVGVMDGKNGQQVAARTIDRIIKTLQCSRGVRKKAETLLQSLFDSARGQGRRDLLFRCAGGREGITVECIVSVVSALSVRREMEAMDADALDVFVEKALNRYCRQLTAIGADEEEAGKQGEGSGTQRAIGFGDLPVLLLVSPYLLQEMVPKEEEQEESALSASGAEAGVNTEGDAVSHVVLDAILSRRAEFKLFSRSSPSVLAVASELFYLFFRSYASFLRKRVRETVALLQGWVMLCLLFNP